ncbi:MAG TPA: CaiB/BaiF CoA-transferase family protein [Jiangellales bacterium]|nr:CaiB/BaiF CoA-transferase family protein [Jiangellales bacterium]
MPGPLHGTRVVELAAVGPVPFAGMLLADLGADVVRVDRLPGTDPYAQGPMGGTGPLGRGRRSVAVDLRHREGADVVRTVCARADVLLEGYRPGVAERLGLGPEILTADNPRLVYARMTGYGQDGPLAGEVGHDLTYLAYAGVLHAIGEAGRRPVPPLNLVGDFGGGGMVLVAGVLAALLERERSGRGQVVDAAMAEGAAYLSTMVRAAYGAGAWRDERGANLLDGGAPHYRCYETSDGRWMAVAALEPAFWTAMLDRLGLGEAGLPSPYDPRAWPELHARLEVVFAGRTRDDWVEVFAGVDACVAPVLSLAEAPEHPHALHRVAYVQVGDAPVPAPVPRLSRTPATAASDGGPAAGSNTDAVLAEAGFAADAVRRLRAGGVVA